MANTICRVLIKCCSTLQQSLMGGGQVSALSIACIKLGLPTVFVAGHLSGWEASYTRDS